MNALTLTLLLASSFTISCTLCLSWTFTQSLFHTRTYSHPHFLSHLLTNTLKHSLISSLSLSLTSYHRLPLAHLFACKYKHTHSINALSFSLSVSLNLRISLSHSQHLTLRSPATKELFSTQLALEFTGLKLLLGLTLGNQSMIVQEVCLDTSF